MRRLPPATAIPLILGVFARGLLSTKKNNFSVDLHGQISTFQLMHLVIDNAMAGLLSSSHLRTFAPSHLRTFAPSHLPVTR
jgi:hypothetical protein